MSFRYGYPRGRKGRYRNVVRAKGVRKKEKLIFFLLLLALFIVMVFLSPVLKNFSLDRGKESVQRIPVLLLAYSIPGMGLEAGSHDGRQAVNSPNEPDEEMSSSLSLSAESEVDNTSIDPVQKPAPEGEECSAAAVARENITSEQGKPPKVLIYHTHTTESFVISSGEAFSNNMEKTVVALGDYLKKILEVEYGISVLHCQEVFDIPRRNAYEKARPAVEEILAGNPGIKVVLDLHRDGVSRSVTTTSVKGLETGRVLFVLGSNHQGWNNNLRFALFLQDALEEVCPGLSRGIRKQPFTYNQHLHQRSLIVEIGGHENSLGEAKRTIPHLAKALAAVMQ